MGAWGTDSWANDDALDFLNELVEADDDTPLFEALANVAEADASVYLSAAVASAALAAAEVIAALAGEPGTTMPEELDKWLSLQPLELAKDLVDAHSEYANSIIHRIKISSELAELWAESDHNDAWHAEVDDLRRRLAGSED